MSMHTIIIPLYDLNDVTFCIGSLYFVYEKKTNQTNKQTNKQMKQLLNWLKDPSKHS